MKNYVPPEKKYWKGRVDDLEDLDSLRWHQVVEYVDLSAKDNKLELAGVQGFCFLGFCCDIGIEKNLGRQGAFNAPFSLRKEMSNLPCYFGKNARIFDAGNVYCYDSKLEKAQEALAEAVEKILALNLFPVLLGGGHEIAFGHYNGIIKSNKSGKLGIINFDAHFDLRPFQNGPNSGTMFAQIADECQTTGKEFSYFCLGIQQYGNTISLFKKADSLKTKYIYAKDIDNSTMINTIEMLDEFIRKQDSIYLTICFDVFSSAYAPGVSAPQPFGVPPEIILRLIKHILRSGKVLSFDIAEVSPRFDSDNRTAKLAAILIFTLINVLSGENQV